MRRGGGSIKAILWRKTRRFRETRACPGDKGVRVAEAGPWASLFPLNCSDQPGKSVGHSTFQPFHCYFEGLPPPLNNGNALGGWSESGGAPSLYRPLGIVRQLLQDLAVDLILQGCILERQREDLVGELQGGPGLSRRVVAHVPEDGCSRQGERAGGVVGP